MTRLIVLLGDQLSPKISALEGANPATDHILMAEARAETNYVPHHQKKIALIFSAMRHFAETLRRTGYRVHYQKLDAAAHMHNLPTAIEKVAAEIGAEQIVMTAAGEWRLRAVFDDLARSSPIPIDIRADSRFICSEPEFAAWAAGRKQLRMEYFYRDMRRKTGLLMADDKPLGGKWNYDSDNRKPAKDDLFMPQPPRFTPDAITKDVLALVDREFADHMGHTDDFWFAVTAQQAEQAADYFITHALADFGTYQDAMLRGQRFLYHSVLSPYINIGLLDPLELCWRVDAAYRAGHVPLNSAEGFIRQIIGWREYVRGIYILKMPDYAAGNYFAADRPLPDFYWTAKTDMACMADAIGQTIDEAYAHHIQRLMVTGNFALLIGVDPAEIHRWYLAVYADAFEWVELPNTIGMSQFADGGILASKPYAASGNYIDKMSDHCASCRYRVKEKTGPDSCPFNSLYWHFMLRHRDKLAGNPRISRAYSTWDRMKDENKRAYQQTAQHYLAKLDSCEAL